MSRTHKLAAVIGVAHIRKNICNRPSGVTAVSASYLLFLLSIEAFRCLALLSIYTSDILGPSEMFFLYCFGKKCREKTPVEEKPEQLNKSDADPQILAQLFRLMPYATVGGSLSNGRAEFIEIKVNNRKFFAMISPDTTLSFCHPDLVQTLNLHEFNVVGLSIKGACGDAYTFSGYCKANLELGQLFIDDIDLLVSTNEQMSFHLMLGADVLQFIASKYRYNFELNANHFKFGPYLFPKLQIQGNF